MQKQEYIPASTALKVIHAGSISALLRQGPGPAFFQEHGIAVESEAGHSVALATAIREGRVRGDLYMSADAQVNQLLLGPANGEWIQWFVVFAYNSAVLVYSPRSRFLTDFEQARSGALPWYEVLLQPGVQIRRNDPNLDPMGYYTLLVCALAQKHYGIPDLQERLLGSPTNPEQVRQFNIAQLESGEIDAMFLYLSAREADQLQRRSTEKRQRPACRAAIRRVSALARRSAARPGRALFDWSGCVWWRLCGHTPAATALSPGGILVGS